MSETWYVVPAAFALRSVTRDAEGDEAKSWILPEGWRKTADPRSGVSDTTHKPRTPLARRSND